MTNFWPICKQVEQASAVMAFMILNICTSVKALQNRLRNKSSSLCPGVLILPKLKRRCCILGSYSCFFLISSIVSMILFVSRFLQFIWCIKEITGRCAEVHSSHRPVWSKPRGSRRKATSNRSSVATFTCSPLYCLLSTTHAPYDGV